MIRLLAFLTLAQVFSICLVGLADFLWYTSYSTGQRLYTVALVLANTGLGIQLIRRNYAILAGKPANESLANSLRIGYQLFILLALYKTYGLTMNGRYLSFPVEQFAIPAFGIIGLIVCLGLSQRKLNSSLLAFAPLSGANLRSRLDRVMAGLLSFGIVALILGETKAFMDGRDFILAHPGFSEGLPFALSYTLHNQQLLSWLACLLVLSLPFWASSEPKTYFHE